MELSISSKRIAKTKVKSPECNGVSRGNGLPRLRHIQSVSFDHRLRRPENFRVNSITFPSNTLGSAFPSSTRYESTRCRHRQMVVGET